MGKQLQTFDKAQALAMHYIPCCKLVALFTTLAQRLGNLFTTYLCNRSCVKLKTKLDMNTDKIVDSKVTTMTDLSGKKSKILLLKNETEIEAFKEQLRLYSVMPRISHFISDIGQKYPANDEAVLIEIKDGYLRFYELGYDFERIYLTHVYVA